MTHPLHTPLKLRAEDKHDLHILSACLQDALLPVTAMAFDQEKKEFTLLANRFCWEVDAHEHEGIPLYARIHAGVHFSNVHGVKHRGFSKQNPIHILSLMCLYGEIDNEIHLVFADGEHICLHVNGVTCHMMDLHDSWITYQKPDHPLNGKTS